MEAFVQGLIARSSLSGWFLCIIGLFGIWRLYVLQRPKILAIEQDGEQKLRGEMWRDIAALKASGKDMRLRLRRAEHTITSQSVQIGQQRFVLDLVISELERVSPGNAVAGQARELLDVVQPAGMPAPEEIDAELSAEDKALIASLDDIPGVGK